MKKREFIKTGILGIGTVLFSQKVSALNYCPKEDNKKWAILYSTWCGSSRDASFWISEGMNGIACVYDVRENPDLSCYENIIIGGSIRAGKVSEEMQDYLHKNANQLTNKVRGHFVVCGNRMNEPTQQQTNDLIDNHLAKLSGASTVPSHVFLGRITYGLLEEQAAKAIKGYNMPEYDNLKRSECMAFGKEIYKIYQR